MTTKCINCGVALSDKNWSPSRQRKHDYICGLCNSIRRHHPESYEGSGVKLDTKPYAQGSAPVGANRPGQGAFRAAVLERDGACVVTGTPVTERIWSKGQLRSLVHAAHIKPLKLCREGEYWDLDNGLAMRADIHAAFDAGLFTIGDNGGIIVSRWCDPEFYPPFLTYKPTKGQRGYLSGHRAWTLKNWSRWAL